MVRTPKTSVGYARSAYGSSLRGANRLLAIATALAVSSGCATHRIDSPRAQAHALDASPGTKLGRIFGPDAAERPGMSGVDTIRFGRRALVARLAMADLAERSLDMQYYIWDPDVTGRLLADRVYGAAERGVRVRILLDDHSIRKRDTQIARLSGHPNIQIRAFNPYRDRRRAGDWFYDASRVNRRSHNKLFIADNTIAIVGGRNIADHYFGTDEESNYRDLDTVATGAVVADISMVFDEFWNSKFAVPYGAFVDETPTRDEAEQAIAGVRGKMQGSPMPYPIDADISHVVATTEEFRDRLVWAPVRIVYDPPDKAEDPTVRRIADELVALADDAKFEILIENAYFVPEERMVERARALVERGVTIRVLTNSLASNDVVAVHSGYKKYRDDLLRVGVQLYELRPDATMKKNWSLLSTRSHAGLHAKAMVIDRRYVIVGSYNLDPRSAEINTEAVLLVDSEEFGARVGAILDDGVRPENSYRVTLEDGDLRWTLETPGGETIVFDREPETSWWQRFSTGMIGILPIQSQL